jgi:hypothetical protein
MKKVILILAVAGFMAGFTSCKKCTTCEWKYNGATYLTYPEICDSKKAIDDWKATVNALYTSTSGYEFVCTDK